MVNISPGRLTETHLCKALGIDPKLVTQITLRCQVGQPIMLELTRFITEDEDAAIAALQREDAPP